MTSEQVAMARDQLYLLLKQVRPEAVPLVDAFDFSDPMLNSALGRYDGDVYNHLYQWAQRAPRNKQQVGIRAGACMGEKLHICLAVWELGILI